MAREYASLGQLNACYKRLRDLTLRTPDGRSVVAEKDERQDNNSISITAATAGDSASSATEPKIKQQQNPHPLKQQRQYGEDKQSDTQKQREERYDGLNVSQWRALGAVKRLWAAHLLVFLAPDLMTSIKSLKCSAGQVIDLRNKAHVRHPRDEILSKWAGVTQSTLAELRTSLRAEVNPKVTGMLEGCPGMTEKIAELSLLMG